MKTELHIGISYIVKKEITLAYHIYSVTCSDLNSSGKIWST